MLARSLRHVCRAAPLSPPLAALRRHRLSPLARPAIPLPPIVRSNGRNDWRTADTRRVFKSIEHCARQPADSRRRRPSGSTLVGALRPVVTQWRRRRRGVVAWRRGHASAAGPWADANHAVQPGPRPIGLCANAPRGGGGRGLGGAARACNITPGRRRIDAALTRHDENLLNTAATDVQLYTDRIH